MKARYQLNLRVFEQPVRNPKTFEEAERNRSPKEIILEPKHRIICGRNVDVCRQNAREFAEQTLKRVVRNVSIGPDGISIVVYSESETFPSDKSISQNSLMRGLPK